MADRRAGMMAVATAAQLAVQMAVKTAAETAVKTVFLMVARWAERTVAQKAHKLG
jgi:hypothetical protein